MPADLQFVDVLQLCRLVEDYLLTTSNRLQVGFHVSPSGMPECCAPKPTHWRASGEQSVSSLSACFHLSTDMRMCRERHKDGR